MKKYSALRSLARPPLERLLPLEFPISMYLETTNRCNFRCRYCPMSLSDYAKTSGGFKTMSLSRFRKICRDIKKGGKLKVLRFYLMGEPLLNPQLPEMIRLAVKMRLAERTELTTNAVLLDEKKSRAIINSGLDYFRVSISSVDPRRHAAVTQAKASVEAIYNNVAGFRRMRDRMGRKKPFLYVKMLDRADKAENKKFLRMYRPVADEAAIEKPMNWDNYRGHDLLSAVYKGKKAPKGLYPYPKSTCPFPFYTLAVSANGDVTACCVDWNKATASGNVFKDSLKSIWNADRLRQLRQMHILGKRILNPSCCNCRFLFTSPDNLDRMPGAKKGNYLS